MDFVLPAPRTRCVLLVTVEDGVELPGLLDEVSAVRLGRLEADSTFRESPPQSFSPDVAAEFPAGRLSAAA